KINIEKLNEVEIVNVLGAADELCLNILVDVLQNVLIDRKHIWMNQKSVLIYNASQKYPTCALLSDMIGEALFQEPDLLLKSVDYVDLEFDTLVWLLQRDDLSMSEMEIWRHVVQWCLNKLDRKLDTDLKKWNDQDFDEFQKVIGPILPYIRWCQIKKEDFSKQVDDFKKIIPDELYEVKDDTIVPSPTYTKSTTRIPSVLITPKQAAKIASWIDGLDLKSKEFYDARNIPYDFNLIVRGSRDQKFYQNTFSQNRCVVIIKPFS
ncbi:14819_t:CDS:1, partial [Entrophospora sp. SA101]